MFSQADEEIEDFPEMPAGDMELIDALERDAVALQDKQDSGSSGEWMLAAPSMDDEPIKQDSAAAGFVANDATARRPCSIAGKGATTEPKPNLSKSVRVPTAKKVKVAGKVSQRTSARLARRSKLGRRTTSTL